MHDVPTIKTYLVANPIHQWMDPPATGDAGTSLTKTRKIVPLPHKIVGLFLAPGRVGVTAKFYFETILPVLEAEGIADDCLSLTHLTQVTILRTMVGSDAPEVKGQHPQQHCHTLRSSSSIIRKHCNKSSHSSAPGLPWQPPTFLPRD